MIEQTLESKIITQVTAAIVTYSTQIVGYWQPSPTGKVKEDAPPFVRIVCMPRENSNENIPQFQCQIGFEIVSKISTDPQKLKHVYWCGQVLDLLAGLVGELTTLASDTYSEDGVYSVKGFKLEAGDIGWDTDEDVWTCNIPTQWSFCTCSS